MNELIAQSECPKAAMTMDREESLSERLERRRDRTQNELNKIQAALDALKANPKVAEVIDLVLKASR